MYVKNIVEIPEAEIKIPKLKVLLHIKPIPATNI